MIRSVGGLGIRGDFLSIFDLKFKGIRGIDRVRIIQSVSFRYSLKVLFLCHQRVTSTPFIGQS